MSSVPVRAFIAFIVLAPLSTSAFAQGLEGFANNIGPGTAHAMKQVGSITALVLAASFLGGLFMVRGSIKRWMETEPNERETMSSGKLIAGLSIGTAAILLPLIVAIGYSTVWGGDGMTAGQFSAFALDGNLAQQSALSIQEGPGKHVPGGALVAFYGVLIIMGLISIYFGLKDAYISIMYGNDMYGTSLPFKTGKIISHIAFGIALIFINDTQCAIVLTFGAPQSMCW